MRRALVVLVFCLLCPCAAANTVEFAAGEQFLEPQPGDFGRNLDAYYTDHRDLSAYSPRMWRLLRREHATLTVHLRYGRDFGPVPEGFSRARDVRPILRGARRHRVPLVAWIVVPYADGYWAHEGNADLMRQAVSAYFPWAKRHRVRARAVLLDFEASIQDTHTVYHLRDDPAAVVELFRRNADPADQCAVAASYADLVDAIHARGLEAAVAAYPFVLDDVLNGDVALSDGLGLPLLVPGMFDSVGFMTMRAVYLGIAGADPGPSLQASYAETIDAHFPGSSLVLGVLGQAPYGTVDAVVEDARTVATVSRAPVGMYSLESLFGALGLRGVRAALRGARTPFAEADAARVTAVSDATRDDRALLATLDAMVGVGTPLAGPSNGKPLALPNPWPAPCPDL
jgi:hypothetical protein